MNSTPKLRITWVKSTIGYSRRQRARSRRWDCAAWGYCGTSGHAGDSGMLAKIAHLVRVEEIAGE